MVTVCEEARCPNLGDCFSHDHATFMILGDTCTRRCGFCAVTQGTPPPPDPDEPMRLARTARRMGLRHVVVTSVDRDDLADGGAHQFTATLDALHEILPDATVEVLIPDFGGDPAPVQAICNAAPTVLNHNLETVSRQYDGVRPGADYGGSLALLAGVKARHPDLITKSGLMAGLGETDAELLDACRDLAATGCDILTLGQYLRPTRRQRPVHRYLTPEAFLQLRAQALDMGFRQVLAGPRVRSSLGAEGTLNRLFNSLEAP